MRTKRKTFTVIGKGNQPGHADHDKYASCIVAGEGKTDEEMIQDAIKNFRSFYVCKLDVIVVLKGFCPAVYWDDEEGRRRREEAKQAPAAV